MQYTEYNATVCIFVLMHFCKPLILLVVTQHLRCHFPKFSRDYFKENNFKYICMMHIWPILPVQIVKRGSKLHKLVLLHNQSLDNLFLKSQ